MKLQSHIESGHEWITGYEDDSQYAFISRNQKIHRVEMQEDETGTGYRFVASPKIEYFWDTGYLCATSTSIA